MSARHQPLVLAKDRIELQLVSCHFSLLCPLLKRHYRGACFGRHLLDLSRQVMIVHRPLSQQPSANWPPSLCTVSSISIIPASTVSHA